MTRLAIFPQTRTTKEVTDWLADHPRRRIAFTPKHASWLNQVEIFFSILARRLLKPRAFTSETGLARVPATSDAARKREGSGEHDPGGKSLRFEGVTVCLADVEAWAVS